MTMRSNKGFTLIELLIVVAIIGIIAVIAIPGLMRARMASNEASAIGSMRAINSAQQSYSQICNGFATLLTQFVGVGGVPSAQPFLSPDMTSLVTILKSGYSMTMAPGAAAAPVTAGPCAGAAMTSYYATAIPQRVGSTGTRGFATNSVYAVFQDTGGVAPPEAAFPTCDGTGSCAAIQ